MRAVPGGDHIMQVEFARETAIMAREFLDANIPGAP
jgi:hypothetical protein